MDQRNTVKIYHLLNGDALKEQFPKDIVGEKLILRECLVDGPVQADGLTTLYAIRSRFISENYQAGKPEEYYEKVVPELEKLMAIPDACEVNLWFEDDLFCQVNFWFALYLLRDKNIALFLVRPDHHSPYGFGAYQQEALTQLFAKKEKIKLRDSLSQLWPTYQVNDLKRLDGLGRSFREEYPFISDAIQAHLDRMPKTDTKGRPKESLSQIMKEFQTEDFVTVFREFSKREAIYGFGDLQVKRMFDELAIGS